MRYLWVNQRACIQAGACGGVIATSLGIGRKRRLREGRPRLVEDEGGWNISPSFPWGRHVENDG